MSKYKKSIIPFVFFVSLLQPAIAEQTGSFHHRESKDPFNDTDRSYIFTMDLNSDGAALGWKCEYDGLNVMYIFDKYLGGDSDDQVSVRYRIDKEKASESKYWDLSENHKSAFMPMNIVDIFTQEAKSGKSVYFEVIDLLDGETIRHNFDISDLPQSINLLSCAK